VQTNVNKQEYLVSAIVSIYNCEKFIKGCLDDLLQQTIASQVEIITINSGSQQNEKKIIQEYQDEYINIKYIETDERETIYKAWNRGIRIASGKYITNANSDDRHRKDAFGVMSDVLEKYDDIDFVFANQLITNHENEIFERCKPTGSIHYRPVNNMEDLIQYGSIGPQPMWKKSLHNKIGYFDENLEVAGDIDLWLRASCNKCKFYHVDELLGLYLLREDSAEHRDWEVFKRESIDVQSYYLNYIQDEGALQRVKRLLSLNCADIGNYYLQSGNIESARKYLWKGIKLYPSIIDNHQLLLSSYLPKSSHPLLRKLNRLLVKYKQPLVLWAQKRK